MNLLEFCKEFDEDESIIIQKNPSSKRKFSRGDREMRVL